MMRALLLAMCYMQADAAANVFFAKMMPLESHGPVGWVAVRVTRNGLVGAGMAKGLEPKLLAPPQGANCTATNGCGTHVHSGTACTDATTQGGHYFATDVVDPWSPVGYTFTTRRGRALFKFNIETMAQDIAQKPFIIHNNAGGRVACGLLDPILPGKLPKHAAQALGMKQIPTIKELEDDEEDHESELDDVDGQEEDNEDDKSNDEDKVDDDDDDDDDEDHTRRVAAANAIFFAKMMPLESHGPGGWVAVIVTRNGLVGAGMTKGLEPKLLASPQGANCTATNGCGTHVHSGTACTDATTQGGHYFATDVLDPWSPVSYTFTTRRGRALFKFNVETMAQDIAQKPFIIHNNAGGRVACGLLHPLLPGKLPKRAALLLGMKQMPTIKELEDDGEDHEDDDENGDEEEDDDDDDDEAPGAQGVSQDGDEDSKEDDDDDDGEGRRLEATTILI